MKNSIKTKHSYKRDQSLTSRHDKDEFY